MSHDLMHVTDWLPTFLAAAGYDVTKETGNKLDGMSLWETLKNPGVKSPRTEVLLNIDDQMYKNAALRVGDWKIVKQSKYLKGIKTRENYISRISKLIFISLRNFAKTNSC